MAKARLSRLEEAAVALAALLTVAAGAVRGVLDRAPPDSGDDELDKAKSSARAIPMPRKSPERCPPDRGRFVTVRWSMSPLSREYQARVTGLPPYTEWRFETVEFDGFRSPECRLQEAKARYDQLFDRKTGLPGRFFELFGGVENVMKQARRQSEVVRNNPPARLTWYFMQPISHKYFSEQFRREKLPIESVLHP